MARLSGEPVDKRGVISVVIPTFNRAGWLRHALDSVLAQTYQDFEIVVVDDGSTDDTQSVVRSYGQQVRYVYQNNEGRGAARNTGVQDARGDLIAFLDSDDNCYPDRLERQVEYLHRHPEAEFLHGPVDVLRQDGSKDAPESRRIAGLFARAAKRGYTYANLLRSCLIFSSTTLVKKTLFERVGLYDPDLRVLEDVEWYLRAARVTRLYYVEGPPLARYRCHEDNAFRIGNRPVLESYQKIFWRNLTWLERDGTDVASRCEAHLALSFCYLGLADAALSRRHIMKGFSASPFRAGRPEVLWRLIRTFWKVD